MLRLTPASCLVPLLQGHHVSLELGFLSKNRGAGCIPVSGSSSSRAFADCSSEPPKLAAWVKKLCGPLTLWPPLPTQPEIPTQVRAWAYSRNTVRRWGSWRNWWFHPCPVSGGPLFPILVLQTPFLGFQVRFLFLVLLGVEAGAAFRLICSWRWLSFTLAQSCRLSPEISLGHRHQPGKTGSE